MPVKIKPRDGCEMDREMAVKQFLRPICYGIPDDRKVG